MVVGAVVAHPLNIRLAQARFGTGPEDASPSSVSPWESHVGFRLLEEALAHHRLGAQGFDEVGGVGDPSEHPLQDEERGVVVASGQSLADWLGRAIGQEHAPEISEHGVPHRRFDADAGGATSEDQVLNSQTAQDQLQVRAIEPAEAVFGDDNIPWLRHELVHNLVFQVSRIMIWPSVPSGVVTLSPTRLRLRAIQFGESTGPRSERSGRYSVLR